MNTRSTKTPITSRSPRFAGLALVSAFALAAAGCGGGGVVVQDFYGDVELQNFAGPEFFVDAFFMEGWNSGPTGNLLFDPLPDNTVEIVATLIEDTYDAEADVYDSFFDSTSTELFPPADVISGLVTVYTVD